MAKKPEKEAEDAPEEAVDGEGEGGEAQGKKKLGVKKLALFAGLPVLILVLGGVAALLLLGGDAEHGDGETRQAQAPETVLFYEMPEIRVNITSGDGRPSILSLNLTLEVSDQAVVRELESKLPRVIDQFQGFLREMRIEDLSGSAGSERLRRELLRRVNLAIAPYQINAVLIEEFLIV